MSILTRTIPTNLLEEKAKFLNDPKYNPQFKYEEPTSAAELVNYGLPQPTYLDLAQEILDQAYHNRNERDLLMVEGQLLTQTEVTERFEAFLKMHHIQNRYQIIWSSSFVSRAAVTSDTVKLRLNSEFRQREVIGTIYHELGTHALRRINYEQQPWFKQKNKYGLTTDYLRTEEGLASLHSLLPRTFQLAYTFAIRYLASHYAQSHSLAEVWHYLGRYVLDEETRWMITFRQKRGVTDTTQGGGFTKDIVYFEGAVRVWHWLRQHTFNLPQLYVGKVACEDAAKAQALNPDFNPILPSFYVLDPQAYAENVETIGQTNHFDQITVSF